jgi:hypothetical protein
MPFGIPVTQLAQLLLLPLPLLLLPLHWLLHLHCLHQHLLQLLQQLLLLP